MCVLIILHLLVIIKRNNLLTTISLYCIPVGKFDKKRFDFNSRNQQEGTPCIHSGQLQTIADLYSSTVQLPEEDTFVPCAEQDEDKVTLYDVLYAYVTVEVSNGR